ncbi:MAG: hypothetical protein ABL308_12620 [Oceanicaulis sp.]
MTRFLAALCVIALALATGGCGATPKPEAVRTVEVLTPVPVSCVPDRPELRSPPEYRIGVADILAAAGPLKGELAFRALAERIARLEEIEPVIAACAEV